ncbi:hypothetical protein X756_24085 [Mesorhizobium sp. LSHC412B00]|nr:hypothetical protein X756_24085 [Mesorhizobium sp. LSHC412B00]
MNSPGFLLLLFYIPLHRSYRDRLVPNVSVVGIDRPQGRSVATRWAGQTENAEDAAALAADPTTIPGDDNVIDAIVRAEAGKSATVGLEGRCLGRCTVVAVFRSRPVVKEIVITPIR